MRHVLLSSLLAMAAITCSPVSASTHETELFYELSQDHAVRPDPCRHDKPAPAGSVDLSVAPHEYLRLVSHCPPGAPPTPVNVTASIAAGPVINLSWLIYDGVAHHFELERSVANGAFAVIQASVTILNVTDAAVSAGVLYHYRVRSVDAAGKKSPYSNVVNVATGDSIDTAPPTVPQNFAFQPIGTTQINLSWSASTDVVGVTGYFVESCQGVGCADFTAIGATTSGTAVTFSDPGRSSAVTYRYRVRARDAAGNLSGYTAVLSAEVPATPPVISAVTSSGLAATNATVTWTTNEVSDSQTEYGTTTAYGSSSPLNLNLVSGHSVTVTGLTAATLYHYRVKSRDAAGNQAIGLDGTFTTTSQTDTSAPTTPTNLSATAVSGMRVDLAWTASTDNVGVTGYRVERCQGAGCTNFVQVASPPAASYSDTTLSPNTTYRYQVRATDAANNLSAFTAPVSTLTSGSTLGAPTNLVATATGTTKVTMTWTASAGAIRYEVHRATNVLGPYTRLAPDPVGTSFLDSTASGGVTYLYTVRAVDAANNLSGFSVVDLATTIIFTDDPLVVGITVIKAIHVTELRSAVNAVRAAAGLVAATWIDPTVTVGTTIDKAVHIQELRNNLNPARTAIGLATVAFTDSTLTAGSTVIKKIHVEELRQGVK